MVSQVQPGYLREALPGACLQAALAAVHLVRYGDLGNAPETGEDFQVIADDYQKLIIPGEHLICASNGRANLKRD